MSIVDYFVVSCEIIETEKLQIHNTRESQLIYIFLTKFPSRQLHVQS